MILTCYIPFNNKLFSFVSRRGYLRCRSRRFDCILLVFFRRWGRLVTCHLMKHDVLLWLVGIQQLRLVHFDPRCCGYLFPRRSAVVRFSCCCVSWPRASVLLFLDRGHPCLMLLGWRRDLHPKWPHRETNENTLLLLYFTTMNNHILFYEIYTL